MPTSSVMLVALVAIGVVLGAFLWVRRHPPFRANVRLAGLDIAALGLVPGGAAMITGDPGAAPVIAAFVLSPSVPTTRSALRSRYTVCADRDTDATCAPPSGLRVTR